MLNSRFHTGLGISPFFATHGFEAPSPVALEQENKVYKQVPARKKVEAFVKRIKEVTDLY